MISLMNMWGTSAAGKIIALVFATIFLIYWFLMNTQFRNNYIDHLPDARQREIRQQQGPSKLI